MNKFFISLIEETKLMKIIIITTKRESLEVKHDLWVKRIEWRPLTRE